jgi:BirA family biotin operon repressor/biotin-[acetyl-CoA-carboxylase] ligase
MYASLAFAPAWPADAWPRLTLVAGLAAHTAIGQEAGLRVGLKWPNDVVVAGGKLGGILTETEGPLVVVGCGVNLWWPDAPAGIAAVFPEDPGPDAASDIARTWADQILTTASGDPGGWGRDNYRSVCVTLGAGVVWDPGGAGMARDIDATGGLVVATSAGVVTLTSGEVRSVRGATVAPGADDETGG